MARISNILLRELPAQHTLSVRRTIDFMTEYSDFSGNSLGAVHDYLAGLGALPGGAPFTCFHNQDLEALDVEVGYPAAHPVPGQGVITANELPARRVVTAIDQGPYEAQDPTLHAIYAWIAENDLIAKGPIYYNYLNDPGRDEEEYLTEMIVEVE